MKHRLPLKWRKLIGVISLILGLILYIYFVMAFAGHYIPKQRLAELGYFLVAGIAWAFPARYLVNWMLAPDDPDGTQEP